MHLCLRVLRPCSIVPASVRYSVFEQRAVDDESLMLSDAPAASAAQTRFLLPLHIKTMGVGHAFPNGPRGKQANFFPHADADRQGYEQEKEKKKERKKKQRDSRQGIVCRSGMVKLLR